LVGKVHQGQSAPEDSEGRYVNIVECRYRCIEWS